MIPSYNTAFRPVSVSSISRPDWFSALFGCWTRFRLKPSYGLKLSLNLRIYALKLNGIVTGSYILAVDKVYEQILGLAYSGRCASLSASTITSESLSRALFPEPNNNHGLESCMIALLRISRWYGVSVFSIIGGCSDRVWSPLFGENYRPRAVGIYSMILLLSTSLQKEPLAVWTLPYLWISTQLSVRTDIDDSRPIK
jgi:hypothetical protein